jgi:sensor histidine kinase YesM
MNPTLKPSGTISSEGSNKAVRAFKAFCSEIWIVPAIAVVIAVLILVIEHAKFSQIGPKFFGSFIYAIVIGFPTALILNWIGFQYSGRFPRLIFLIYTTALVTTASLGSLIGALILRATTIIPADFYWREVQSSLPICLVITLIVGLSTTSFETLRHRLQDATLELRTRQVEQERANKLLVEARLSSLESRIHPHFLFNTLNSIAALIPTDPQRAENTVGKLASLLRFSISANQTSLVPLAQELKIVRDYLEIESTRFGQRLRYEISVPDVLGGIKVPPLALQTLVENSVKHVAAQSTQPALIKIVGELCDGQCELAVIDDGPGFSLAGVAPDHGLGNLIGRLELLFEDSAQLSVRRVEDKTVVSISIPVGETKWQ